MAHLSDEQLNSLNRNALIILVSSLQDQLEAANARLAENSRKIDLLTEQIRLLNQRQFGRK